jgi:acetyl-CoA C-acetyltransferase
VRRPPRVPLRQTTVCLQPRTCSYADHPGARCCTACSAAPVALALTQPAPAPPGALRDWHPISLGARVVDEVVQRSGGEGKWVEDVIVGCVSQVGAQAGNIGRNIVMASNLPEHVPGTTVDRQCGSSQQAIHFAAQAVMSGTMDVVIAAGVESMTNVPIGANVADAVAAGHGIPTSDEIKAKYGAALEARGQKFFSQFEGAEIVAEQYELTREDLDSFAVKSHARAVVATQEGRFKREILPLQGLDKEGNEIIHDTDEGIRPGTTMEGLAKLKDLKGASVSAVPDIFLRFGSHFPDLEQA